MGRSLRYEDMKRYEVKCSNLLVNILLSAYIIAWEGEQQLLLAPAPGLGGLVCWDAGATDGNDTNEVCVKSNKLNQLTFVCEC